jgi:hypothetical protein
MASTTVTRGNSHETFYIGPSLTPTAVSAQSTSNQTFSVPGLLTTDIIVPQGYITNQISGVFIVEADCLTAGVLTVQFGNFTAGSVTPSAGVYEFQIVRLEGPTPVNAA